MTVCREYERRSNREKAARRVRGPIPNIADRTNPAWIAPTTLANGIIPARRIQFPDWEGNPPLSVYSDRNTQNGAIY